MDELHSEGAIDPSSSGAGFYSTVFVVLKCTGGLWPILTLKTFNCYLHIPSYKMPTPCTLFSMVIMLSPLISRMFIYIFLLLNIIVVFLNDLFGTVYHISGRFYLLGWPQPLGYLQPSLNPSCSFAIAKVSILLSIWMTSWCWFALSGQVRRLTHFYVPYWFT